ncbi:tumor susceptibility gene 101 protein isoform X2 [Oryzias melastigma]|uniref:Tumor susceptibility 101a n=1 Tax=Oryzias melastigma TaxID=30732 RepID=A0A3B3DS92_ORYME|nr:tumor susceptibility gene 101 protein isoform X2 [Oryzias melastigma]
MWAVLLNGSKVEGGDWRTENSRFLFLSEKLGSIMTLTETSIKKMLPTTYVRSFVAHEIFVATTYFKNLKPAMDRYVFRDGTAKTLMSLTGTIPVTFSGNLYNIPVCVWIKERYPQAAPICYVKPTPEMMMVRRGFLSGDGQVILPYLKEWKKGDCDLIGLLQVMVAVFGEFPPVSMRPFPEKEQGTCRLHTGPDGNSVLLLPSGDGQPLQRGNETNC